nr:hypothetical protein [Pandoravirus belohorizontensis]
MSGRGFHFIFFFGLMPTSPFSRQQKTSFFWLMVVIEWDACSSSTKNSIGRQYGGSALIGDCKMLSLCTQHKKGSHKQTNTATADTAVPDDDTGQHLDKE